MSALILAYHRVGDIPGDPLVVRPDALEAQLRWLLSKGYAGVSLTDAVAQRVSRCDRKTFAVTFDDGYADTLSDALPVLDKVGVRATVFVVPAFADAAEDGSNAGGSAYFLGWDGLALLQDRGHEIGSHTQNHVFLAGAPDDVVSDELERSRRTIADHLGRAPVSFCYPGGSLAAGTPVWVAAAGYERAVLTAARAAPPEGVFTVRRVGVYGHTTLAAFRLKTNRLLRPVVEAARWKSFARPGARASPSRP